MPKVLLSDTVGFIKKLPHDLVASFRSTLDEALNADLLLYVVDSADPTFRSQLEVTKAVLHEIGVQDTATRLILNKRDRLNEEESNQLREEFPEAILISTREPQDLRNLREHLVNFFESNMHEERIFVPYSVQGAIGEIRARMRVLSEDFDENGVHLLLRAEPLEIERLKRKFSL